MTITVDQHVFEPYVMSEALQRIMTFSFDSAQKTLYTGVPILG